MSDRPAFGRKTSQRYKETVHKNTQTSQIYYGSVRKPPLEFFPAKPLSESPSSECVHKLVSHTKMDARRCTDCAVCDQKSHSGAHRRCRDWVPITFEVITLRSGRLFRKFFMIRKAGKVMQVTGPMVMRGSRFGMPLFLVGSKGGVRWAQWFGGF